ncbi:D-amino acid dehydrogenase [Erythrobacter sp. AP23]|uniref:D-amino acid dehydrogenase n=1 Tax=Erythrobacter sp. AP23 TaxID=499656 RepID=UPI00076C1AFD|nr:D-amino acid dehydrogenase [Erythrobacter sp. AP23]KWV93775.1 amino acid dehydrogenase [Erythrobacter sp. AP23]
MRVVVLGAGVVGVTSAYYLKKAGFDVTVLDRQSGPALETSYANAGEISPGYASPWATPGLPRKVVKWMLMKDSPLAVRPSLDPAMWRWMLEMLQNCTTEHYAINKRRMLRLAAFSREELARLCGELTIDFDFRSLGTLQLFRTQRELDSSAEDVEALRACGVEFELLDRQGCVEAEPGLSGAIGTIAGGLRLPGDQTGDCHKFTRELAARLTDMGTEFLYDTQVVSIDCRDGRIDCVNTDEGPVRGDLYLSALASFTPKLLKPLDIRLPIYPVKGYSITVPVEDHENAPASTILDDRYKVAITRLGNRIRVGGMAEISGFDRTLHRGREGTLRRSLEELFPRAATEVDDRRFWTGLRPMTPDGPPIIGPTPIPNLFINAGHGTLGWTMACGSGNLVAAMMAGDEPCIDPEGLTLMRYG